MRTVQSWTCELGYGADTMFHRTYFLLLIICLYVGLFWFFPWLSCLFIYWFIDCWLVYWLVDVYQL